MVSIKIADDKEINVESAELKNKIAEVLKNISAKIGIIVFQLYHSL